jgi:CheY-like chemotaxis protein
LLALDKAAADLILLDIAMPGMNGTTFLGIIRNDVRRVGIPVIVITALEPEDLRARVADLNVGVILEKGDTQFVDKLLAAVRSGLN